MAIRDVLWACPLCRRVAGIRGKRREHCIGCGAAFRRGRGATIVAERGEQQIRQSAAEWLRILGDASLGDPVIGDVILGPEPVVVRVAQEQRPLRHRGELLGWIEVFGPATPGTLTLTAERLTCAPGARSGSTDGLGRSAGHAPAVPAASSPSGSAFDWPLRAISAVQPASSALQVAAGKPVASIRFPQSSLRLWARALTAQLRRLYAADGLDITEFQPCIRTCSARARSRRA